MFYLSVDPGLSTGWALWARDSKGGVHLAKCGADPTLRLFATMMPSVAVIERPKIYQARLMKGDPNDIVTLAIRVGRYIERLEQKDVQVLTVYPNEWKGQLPKEVHHPRIFGKLNPAEQAVVSDAGQRMGVKARADMMDAIGIGQYAVTMGYFRG